MIGDAAHLPRISVVIPVYKPNMEYLEATIRSVVDSGVASEAVEIVMVDSTGDRSVLDSVVRRYPFIRHHRNENVGIARNWNRCIEVASCDWVHILHADDLVLPGYYDELLRAEAQTDISVFVSRFFIIDELGNVTSVSHLEQKKPGFLDGAPRRIVARNTIQCPSIAVRRDVYRSVGGFNSDLRYVLDWEMWFRISLRYPMWYVPKPLACFRMHSMSETPRAKASGESARDMIKGVRIVSAYAPSYGREARQYGAQHILNTAVEFLMVRKWIEAGTQLRLAPLCLPQIVLRLSYIRCWIWVFRIIMKNSIMKIFGPVTSGASNRP